LIRTLLDRVEASAALPAELRRLYDGDLGFREGVSANFVETLDGVVSYALPGQEGGGVISGRDPGDRFIMDLLRASADAIVVGAKTFAAVPASATWVPGEIYPAARGAYAAYRREELGKVRPPLLVVVSGLGRVALPEGAVRMASPEEVVPRLRAEFGARHILLEGGPRLFGEFVAAGGVDELFLTLSPQLAGRATGGGRPGLIEGLGFTPEQAPWLRLASVKVGERGHLYLRYGAAAPPFTVHG